MSTNPYLSAHLSVCPPIRPSCEHDLRDEADVLVGQGWKAYRVRKQTSVRRRTGGSEEEEEEEKNATAGPDLPSECRIGTGERTKERRR